MKILSSMAVMIIACLSAASAAASIIDFKVLEIDFTDIIDAAAKASWSEPDIITITVDGLGWDAEPASSRDGWIKTAPMALGLSWRPPMAISIRVTIQPEPQEFTMNNGQSWTPYQGDVYVRYSADASNWSTWQVLQQPDPQTTEVYGPGRHFYGTVRVPYSEINGYQTLLQQYAELDVPWKSDEDAAARWIVGNDPDFFERQIPFIGYIEFLYEDSFHGSVRLTSFKAEVSYGMSGLHYPPENDDYGDRDSTPWSFRGSVTEN
jgi:hypothetical protein